MQDKARWPWHKSSRHAPPHPLLQIHLSAIWALLGATDKSLLWGVHAGLQLHSPTFKISNISLWFFTFVMFMFSRLFPCQKQRRCLQWFCGAVPGHICPISPKSPPHGCQLGTITVRRGCKLKLGPRPPELRLPDPTKPNYPIQKGTVTCSGIRINSLFRIAPQLHSSRVCLVIPALTTSIFSICPNIYFLHIQRDGDIGLEV